MRAASLRSLNPLRLLPSASGSASYEKLPGGYDPSLNGAPPKGRYPSNTGLTQRLRWSKVPLRIAAAAIMLILFLGFLGGGHYSGPGVDDRNEEDQSAEEHANTRYWEVFARSVYHHPLSSGEQSWLTEVAPQA